MSSYQRNNIITGWVIFIVAAVTYLLTKESSVSLWDCGEFIASAFKLEVGHPPGAPFFMIIARVSSLFAGNDTTMVAAMVNSMSALASAFTILFLFWTITNLASRMVIKGDQITTGDQVAILGAGIVGALAYTFSDTFWFSAVEGEVYATSSLFTAAVFWAILKWEKEADEPYSDRWLILIAYLMGLSIGVHLLNLLTLPAIVFVYYFRKFPYSNKGFFASLGVSLFLLIIIMYGIIPGVVTLSSWFELAFVNGAGLPFNTGMFFHLILMALVLFLVIKATLDGSNRNKIFLFSALATFLTGIWILTDSIILNILILAAFTGVLWYVAGKSNVLLNTVYTSIAVIMIGYSSFAIIMIRSSAETPMNENDPSNIFSMLYYLNREQYGSRPLVSGPYFNAPVTDYDDGKPTYNQIDGRYKITNRSVKRVYDERFTTILPRMWSDQDDHQQFYKDWTGMKGTPIQVTDRNGNRTTVNKPTFGENLGFMISYQVGYMYLRYFMWNFAGRQNDVQGYGGAVSGNWISGIRFIDEPRIGSSDMPDSMKNDPSRNTYFMLPLLLGIAGLIFQLYRDNRNWWIVMLLFIMTGIAIVVYLNQYPNQPRERDYAYAASFYAFAIWIGLGVLAVGEWLSKLTGKKVGPWLALVITFAAVPVLMARENWDDHDRSGRYLTIEVARNYLNSCAPNAIIFTNGDNDTFPLWYAQEVEGVRPDIRVCNLMLFNTDWYIEQMKKKMYDSDPMPISLPLAKYYDGVNNQLLVLDRIKEPQDISRVIDFVRDDSKASKIRLTDNSEVDYIPTKTVRLPVDQAAAIASGAVKPEDADKIVPYIDIQLKSSSILKSQLMVLDFLANNKWERPVYYVTGYQADAFGLEEYFQLDGFAYRLVPIKSQNRNWLEYGRIDPEIAYANMVEKFTWRSGNDPKVHIDHHHQRTLTVIKLRYNYARLAKSLVAAGDNERAVKALDYCLNSFPPENLPYDLYIPDMVEGYLMAGATDKGVSLAKSMSDYFLERADYYLRQRTGIALSAEYEIQTALQYSNRVAAACETYGAVETADEINKRVEELYARYLGLRGAVGK